MLSAPRTGWIFLLAALVAVAVRLPGLENRPMHTDEAVNAYLTSQVLAGEPFRYDPQDRHGPALFALTAPMARLCGAHDLASLQEIHLRYTAVLTSALVALACGLLVRPLGLIPALLTALLWIIAPAPLYYGRYIIHESGFIAATVLFLALLLRDPAARGVAAGAGASAGLMLAFKETAALPVAAAGAALLLADPARGKAWLRPRVLLASAAAALGIVLFAFSWGGTDWPGVGRLVDAATRFLARAGGEGHEKPWTYYLHLLAFGRAGPVLLALALVGAWRGWRSGGLRRFLPLYTVALLAVHSAIPYKTPWLALALLLPIFLLAGLALERPRAIAIAGGLALLATMAWDGRRAVWRDPAGERNPFAYAHTTDDLLRLPDVISAWQSESGREPVIAVVAADPWPLPWYLRTWSKTGYWRPGEDPGPADIYIADMDPGPAFQTRVEQKLPEFFGVRPGALLVLYARPRLDVPPRGPDADLPVPR